MYVEWMVRWVISRGRQRFTCCAGQASSRVIHWYKPSWKTGVFEWISLVICGVSNTAWSLGINVHRLSFLRNREMYVWRVTVKRFTMRRWQVRRKMIVGIDTKNLRGKSVENGPAWWKRSGGAQTRIVLSEWNMDKFSKHWMQRWIIIEIL